jgi:hypothetical protein
MLRGLLAFALVYGLTGVAKAQDSDFQMVVIDPPVTGTFYDITTPETPLTDVQFGACLPGEVPSGSGPYAGCILFLNGTGQILDGLQFSVPYADGVVGQTASCPTDPNDIFTNTPTCPADPMDGTFTLSFSGGPGIPASLPGAIFVVAESGVDPTLFPEISVVANVPESRSMSLLVVDVLMSAGFIGFWRRRHAVRVSQP